MMTPKVITHLMFMASLLATAGCATLPPPPAVSQPVDLPRFMGPWYVIAGQFTWIERAAHNGIESYALTEDGTIATTYQFRHGGFDGPLKTYQPTGRVVPGTGQAEWRMQFVWPFQATFLILYLDPDYRFTVIGEPDRRYLWVMAREPRIPDAELARIRARLSELGYAPERLTFMPQRWPEAAPR